jgi:hypothetical protein
MGLWEFFFGKSEAQKRAEEIAKARKSGPWFSRPADPGMPDANRRDLNAIERDHGGSGSWW